MEYTAIELPAIGDDRCWIAEELLRLAKLPELADKGGLVMQLQTAATVLLRADIVIKELAHQLQAEKWKVRD